MHATDFDGFDNSAATVARFHALAASARSVTSTSAPGRTGAPTPTGFRASVLGRGNGWPGERWLDIRRLSVLEPIMIAALSDVPEPRASTPSSPTTSTAGRTAPVFHLTAHEQLVYDEWVAQRPSTRSGMAVFQKGDPDQAARLEPYFDGALDEQCHQYDECYLLSPYLRAGKPVLDAEYKRSLYPGFCARDNATGDDGRALQPRAQRLEVSHLLVS